MPTDQQRHTQARGLIRVISPAATRFASDDTTSSAGFASLSSTNCSRWVISSRAACADLSGVPARVSRSLVRDSKKWWSEVRNAEHVQITSEGTGERERVYEVDGVGPASMVSIWSSTIR